MLKSNKIKYNLLLVILSSISVVTADQIDKKNVCYKTHEEKASSLFPKPQLSLSHTEKDINNDGKNEIIYSGNCGARLCDSIVLAEINGCYLAIFGIQGNVTFLDKVPQKIKSEKLFKISSLDSNYQPISSFVSHCAGRTRSSSIYLFNGEELKYIEVYSETYDFCDL